MYKNKTFKYDHQKHSSKLESVRLRLLESIRRERYVEASREH